MTPKKKAQAALEYLTTYGWVILVVVIGIGTLAYFGFLNPQNFIPERCSFGTQLICEDFMLDTTANRLSWKLRNNFAKDIEILDVISIDAAYPLASCNSFPEIGVGKTEEIICDFAVSFYANDKYSIPLSIQFQRNDTPSPPVHNVTGEIYSVAI